MKIIYTSKGQEILVDDCDFEDLNKYLWRINDQGYVIRSCRINSKKTAIRMHRVIMQVEKGQVIDHINHITTDNRKKNLRICTQAENMHNTSRPKHNTSGVVGVSWAKTDMKWVSHIRIKGKAMYLGIFTNLEDAIKARYDAEIKYFGEFRNNLGTLDVEKLKSSRKRVCDMGSKELPKNNTSGVKGVSWRKDDKMWIARIGVNKTRIFLGYFNSFEDAVVTRKEAEQKYFGGV